MDKKPNENILEQEIGKALESKPRSATLLNLKWIAEKLRKSTRVRSLMDEGKYEINSEDLAKSLLNEK